MKIKKLVTLSAVLLVVLFCTPFTISAQAHTFESVIPTYGLYCENSELIKSSYVKFDFTDNELFSKGICKKRSEYHVSAYNREVEFAIPFVSSAINMPDLAVTVNGQEVEGSVWYGHSGYWQDYDFDIDKTYSPFLDESIIGTLYTFIPDNETITVSLKLNEWKSYIYETTNHYSSYNSADGSHMWTLKEASPLHEYSFFIFGDTTDCTFDSSCGYRTETISCKEFIDKQYKKFEEYYDHIGVVPIELFYSIVNRVIQENTVISHNELFLRSIDTYRVNAYKFEVSLEADAVISYELPIDVHKNYAYDPIIYGVEQKNVGDYNTNYIIKLNGDIPFIIESSVSTERDGTVYKAEAAEDFSFVFSALEHPKSIDSNNNRIETWQIVLFVLLGVVACVFIISTTILIISFVKNKKQCTGNK